MNQSDMLQTIIVYSSIMIVMMLYGVLASRRAALHPNQSISFFNWEVLHPLLFFALIFGMRYDVGVDHLAYLYGYQTGIGVERYEPIFGWITTFGADNNIHYTIYFGVLAFIQVFLLFYTFKDERYLFVCLAFVLFAGQFFWHWMNGIRQDTAACIFIFSVKYISGKQFWKYFVCCIIACGFHKSALLLFLIYPLLRGGKDYFSNVLLQLSIVVFVSALLLSGFDILNFLGSFIETFVQLLEYEQYSEGVLNRYADLTKIGVSLYCLIILDIVIVLYSKKMKEYYNSRTFITFYNLYYIGAVAQILFANNMILARPFRYFRYFKLVVAAYLLYYLYKHAKPSMNIVVFGFVIFVFFVLFAALMKNEPFTFFWQVKSFI